MNTKDDFYVTLSSTSSKDYYSSNTISNFRVKLPTELTTEGDYEVGLADLNFPKYFKMKEQSYAVYNLKTGYSKVHIIPQRVFRSSAELVYYINDMLYNDAEVDIKLIIDPLTNIVTIFMGPHSGFWTEIELFNLLGFYDKIALGDFQAPISESNGYLKREATVPCTLNFVYTVYVYTDIIAMEIVGDIKARLLEIVPVNESSTGNINYRASKIRYHPLEKKTLHEIEIELRSSLGESIPFSEGKVLVCLHFRRRV